LNTTNNDLDEFYKLLELRDFDKAEVRILKLLSYNPKDYLLLNNYANGFHLKNSIL
jgi:hypothetical protein